MDRRDFLHTASASLLPAGLTAGLHAAAAQQKPLRVGLIGTGWYGKCSLFRLIQVAPIEIVSLCDPDRRMREEAATLLTERQKTDKKPRLYGDYREMLKEKDLDICMVETPDHWHALPMIAACEACADWPESAIALVTVSVARETSCWLVPSSAAARLMPL